MSDIRDLHGTRKAYVVLKDFEFKLNVLKLRSFGSDCRSKDNSSKGNVHEIIGPNLRRLVIQDTVCDNCDVYVMCRRLRRVLGDPARNELWKYSIYNKTWKLVLKQDSPKTYFTSNLVLGGNVLLGLGFDRFISPTYTALQVCCLKSNSNDLEFKVVPTSENVGYPIIVGSNAAFLTGEYLYTIILRTRAVYKLSLKSREWNCLYICNVEASYEEFGFFNMAFDCKKIYVIGRQNYVSPDQNVTKYDNVLVFDFTTNTWESLQTFPDPKWNFPTRNQTNSFQHGHYFFLFTNSTSRAAYDVWRLDLSTLKWTQLQRIGLPKAVTDLASCIAPSGKLIKFMADNERRCGKGANVYTAWLGVPKLKEICWDAVNYYHPEFKSFTRQELHFIGIPQEFIDRLA